MFKRICTSLAATGVLFAAFFVATQCVAAQTNLPPLIDRELIFGNPEISGAQLSPDGKFIAFMKPFKDTRNVWVKRVDEPFEKAKLITNRTDRPIPGYFWSRDGKYVLFTQDKAGDENYNVYAVNPNDPVKTGEEVPAARNITDAQKVRAIIFAVPKSDPDTMYVGLNDRDPAWHDLYKVKISTGERTLLQKNTDRIGGYIFDNADKMRLAVRSAENGDTEILRLDADNKTVKIYTCNLFETCLPVRFNKDNSRVYLETNKGNPDLSGLVLFDPATMKEEMVESDPLKRVDFGRAEFSDLTDEMIFTSYQDDKNRIYWKDKAYEADYKLLQSKLPNKEIAFASSTADEQLWLISAFSDTEPGETLLFDRKTKKLTPQYKIREKINRADLAPMTTVRYKSSDGLEIPAYLTLPKGVAAKNLPVIVFPHGGPWARDNWGYNPYAQFLANRGYAVLAPNFRSSTGYGKKFLNSGNKQWGQLMQDDLTWGVKYLVAEGIADPKRIGIMGGSYGGYATLAGVAFTPDLYSAAVAIVAPSNLITLLESIPPYWEAGRKQFTERMGDPGTPAGKELLMKQSPLFSADKIKTPLFVVQGANDPRVNKREADQIVIALRDRNYPVEYMVAPDEGHGFARPVNNMAMLAKAEMFLAKHLGGRAQETMSPEVAKRLSEITVDPKTVQLAKKAGENVTAPKPAMPLKTGKAMYKGTLSAGGQNIAFTNISEITEENGMFKASETAQFPQGEISDTTFLEKGTLFVKKRVVKQGPVTFDVEFNNGKVTGSMAMGGNTRPINAALDNALFADGAGAYDVIGTLPLAPGYATSFSNFNLQKQKIDAKVLKVVGTEKTKIAAGEFDAYKVDITDADNDASKITVWIAQDTRRLLKLTGSPQPGVTINYELADASGQPAINSTTVISEANKAATATAPNNSVSANGKWDVMANANGQQIPITLEFKQDGTNVTGSISSPVGDGTIKSGKISGKTLTATASVEVQGQMMELTLEGLIDGDKMTGTMSNAALPPISFTGAKAN